MVLQAGVHRVALVFLVLSVKQTHTHTRARVHTHYTVVCLGPQINFCFHSEYIEG